MRRRGNPHHGIAGLRTVILFGIALCWLPAAGVRSRAADQAPPAVPHDRQMDVVYGYKDGMGLLMDVLTPRTRPNGAGVVVIASGALISSPTNLRSPNWQEKRPVLAALLGRGYVLFVAKHGSQPRYTLPDIDQDMPRAVRFIRHHASRFGIDPRRIGVTGGSSGGQLALHLATSAPGPNTEAPDELDRESSRVQAVAAYFPATDLVNFGAPGTLIEEHLKLGAPFDFKDWNNERRVFTKIDDPRKRRAIFVDCSPITHVSRDDPPTLLLHGDQDPTVPIQQSRVFLRRMQDTGAVCRLIEFPGKWHGWDSPAEGELEAITGWFDRWLLAN